MRVVVREHIVVVVVTVNRRELSLGIIDRSGLIMKRVNELFFVAKTSSRRISLVQFPHLSDLCKIHWVIRNCSSFLIPISKLWYWQPWRVLVLPTKTSIFNNFDFDQEPQNKDKIHWWWENFWFSRHTKMGF